MINSIILDPDYINSILEKCNIAYTEVKKKLEGLNCKICKTYNEYAEPNQEDKSFICYSCRTF